MEKWMLSQRVGSSSFSNHKSSLSVSHGVQRLNPCPRCTFENRIEVLCCEICGGGLSVFPTEDIDSENFRPTSSTLIQSSCSNSNYDFNYRRKLTESSNEILIDSKPVKTTTTTAAAIVIDLDSDQHDKMEKKQPSSFTLPNASIIRQVAENKRSVPLPAKVTVPTALPVPSSLSTAKNASSSSYGYKDGSDDSFVVEDDDNKFDQTSINSDDNDSSSSIEEISDDNDNNSGDPEVEFIRTQPTSFDLDQPLHHSSGGGGGVQYADSKVNTNGSIHREIPPSFPDLSTHFWSVKQISRENCCSINFNDFTLDHGRYNPNTSSVAPSISAKRAAGVSLDENYEKRKESRQSKGRTKSSGKDEKKRRKRKREDNDDNGDKPKKASKKSYFRKGSFYRKKGS